MSNDEAYQATIDCLALAIVSSAHSHEDLKLLVSMLGLSQKSSSEVDPIIDDVLSSNMDKVNEYNAGKTKLLGFFVGQVMKRTGGTANPASVNDAIKNKLSYIMENNDA